MAPSFARMVDIHRKPGYDPLELFIDSTKRSIPFDTSLLKGSHGRPVDMATEEEGYSFYASNIRSNLPKDTANSLDVVQIGKYLKNLL
jgi:hypothetical protein